MDLTSFEKSSFEEIKRQSEIFLDKDIFEVLLDATPNYMIVLNENRQIIYANKAMKELFGEIPNGSIYGKRPGEVLLCQHAFANETGCGTTEFCKTCGALNAILSSLKGENDVQECRIIRTGTQEALDLRVWTKPLYLKDERFSIFTFVDISHEKRRMALERIFFHDVLNTASGIKSFMNILYESTPEEIQNFKEMGSELAEKLLEEIKSQRDLELAENGELEVKLQICNPVKLIQNVVSLYKKQNIANRKKIEIKNGDKYVNVVSDIVLISRVLGNMLKNALEASENNTTVTLGYDAYNGGVRFFVHNFSYIPKEIQLQIFNRSFSTKSTDRGLGTYSMKLLTEIFLKGKVYFESSEEKGTTFYSEFPSLIND